MLKSPLINISVSANTHQATAVTPSKQPEHLVERIVDFPRGRERPEEETRIPTKTALHERPTPTFPFSLMSSRICTHVHYCRAVRTNDDEPKLARFLPKKVEAYEGTEQAEMSQTARVAMSLIMQ
jgi:hypothetical protein